MPTVQIQCCNCPAQFVGVSSLKGKMGLAQVAASAKSYGWVMAADGQMICSESCAADHALDVTPKTGQLPPPPKQLK